MPSHRWEEHSGTIASHYEALLAEWQTANAFLLQENENYKKLVENFSTSNSEPVNQSIEAGALKDLYSTDELGQLENEFINKQQRFMALMKIWSDHYHADRESLQKEKAFMAWKLFFTLEKTKQYYRMKCNDFLNKKIEEIRNEYENGLGNSNDPNDINYENLSGASIIRQSYKESASRRAVACVDNTRVNSLILVRVYMLY